MRRLTLESLQKVSQRLALSSLYSVSCPFDEGPILSDGGLSFAFVTCLGEGLPAAFGFPKHRDEAAILGSSARVESSFAFLGTLMWEAASSGLGGPEEAAFHAFLRSLRPKFSTARSSLSTSRVWHGNLVRTVVLRHLHY
eukprot:1094890-Pleurochrysis_carterae.AAC.1